MDGTNRSIEGQELKERYSRLPEIVAPLKRRSTQPTMEELAIDGDLSKLQQINDSSKLHRRSKHGFTLLHHAAKENKAEIIEFLVSKGCDIDADDDEEQTALHKAAMFGYAATVKVLLDNGANVNKGDGNGNTPLHIVIFSGGDIEVIKVLMVKADPCVKNNEGQNALHFAVKYHKVDAIDLILNCQQISEAITSADNEGYTTLHLAVSLGHFDTTEELLNMQNLGIDISATTKKGKNIIHLAATANNANLLALILEVPNALCLINKSDNSSCTPLHDAAKNGNLKQVTLLLDRGGMIVTTKDGFSPLHYACFRGHLNVATKLLKRHPFQKDLVTNNGDTALHLAATNGHSAIVKLLLDNDVPITHNVQQASFLDIAMFKRDNCVATVAVNHERWQECLDLVSPIHPAPMIHLIQTVPDAAQAVMDHSITSAQLHQNHPCYWKQYDFKYLLDEPKSTNKFYPHRNWYQLILHYLYSLFTIPNENDANPLKVIKTMLQHNRKNLLVHPLLLTFLNLKWRNYGRYYIQIRASLLTLLTVFLTALVGFSDPPRPSVKASNCTVSDSTSDHGSDTSDHSSDDGIPGVLAILTLVVNFGYAVVLVMQLVSYIRQRQVVHWFHTFVELCTVVSTAVFILSNPTDRWLAAVVALLCAWVSLNLFSRYFDVFGLYTIMFYDLLIRITKAIAVGLYYIIGFGLIIYILIGEETVFSTPPLAVYNTFFAAFSGGLNHFELLARKEEEDSFQYRKSTYTIILVMTVVLTITLVNLLIGISVGSIGNIQKDALLHQAKLKILLFLELDPNIPRFLKRKVIPKSHKHTGQSISITDKAYDLWNYIISKFAPRIQGCDHDHQLTKENQEDEKQRDMHYRIKQIECQVESLLKHQKLFMEEMRMNYKNNVMKLHSSEHRCSYSTAL
ncbi:transient receptor potential cation channel subfamily A member 1-like [Dysidea avara]|uniref:transient receptor potential cation channel subfamily A member 1-like n=1 Tax=Dysidea avara TaxID=196820 RepID=UPI0033257444